MAMSLKHAKVSTKDDGTDSNLVRPTDWNAEHVLTSGAGVVLGRPTGATPAIGPVQELPLSAMFLPGMVSAYAGATPPTGWLLCNGASLVRADNAALFAVIGVTYGPGSSPGTTFALPDLRGRVPAGVDGGANRLPGWVAGTAGGASASATGTFNMSALNTLDYGNMTFTQQTGSISTGNLFSVSTAGGSTAAQAGDPVAVTGYTRVNGNFTIGVSGGSNNFNIVQPTIALNYIIKT